MLTDLFSQLKAERVRYAVLRNYETLPESLGGSDLDLVVHRDDVAVYLAVLRKVFATHRLEVVSVLPDKTCPRVLGLGLGLGLGLQLDIHVGVIQSHKAILFDWDYLSKHIIIYKSINVLDNSTADIIAFLKEILNNGYCKEKYFYPAKQSITEMSSQEKDEALTVFSPSIRSRICNLLAGDYPNRATLKKLGKDASADIISLKIRMLYYFGQIKKIKRFFKPTGYVLVFLGTDGSGKSTIINRITPILNEAFHNSVYYEHLRPNVLPSLAVLTGRKSKDEAQTVCTDPHGGQTSGFAGSLVRLSYYLIDYTFGYYRKVFVKKSTRSCVWIFDRYYYDYLIDPKRNCIRLPKWIIRLLGCFVPKPDLTVCLGTDAETIHRRKPELPLPEIERQVAELKSFAEKTKNAVWIDTGCTIEESVEKTMGEILKMMKNRGFRI